MSATEAADPTTTPIQLPSGRRLTRVIVAAAEDAAAV
jgi:hypothetical protein